MFIIEINCFKSISLYLEVKYGLKNLLRNLSLEKCGLLKWKMCRNPALMQKLEHFGLSHMRNVSAVFVFFSLGYTGQHSGSHIF